MKTNDKIYMRNGSAFKPVGHAEEFLRLTDQDMATDSSKLPSFPIRSIQQLQHTFIIGLRGVLANSDIAFIKDRRFQVMMRRDPDIMSPLRQRQTAVAQLEWDIVAQDEDDDAQAEQAAHLKMLITRYLRRQTDFLRNLQEAVWYGPSAINVYYESTMDGIAPVRWMPIHPDAVAFNEFGDLGMYVGNKFEGDKVPGPDGFGMVHIFDASEREAIVLHTHDIEAADREESLDARVYFSGRGLRDRCYFPWLMKQKAQQIWMTFIERYALGMRETRFPEGNDEAKAMMETIANNLIDDVTMVLPWFENETYETQPYQFRLHETQGTQSRTFADLIEGYLAGQLKELIIGQTATTEATNSGLGSDVATRHAETFQRIIRMDASNADDSLTHGLVRPMARLNFGPDTPLFSWRFSVDKVNPKEWLEAADKALGMGVDVSEQQAAEIAGLVKPESDEDSLRTRKEEREQDPMRQVGGFNFHKMRGMDT